MWPECELNYSDHESKIIVKMMHNRHDNAVNKFQLDNIVLELPYLINYSIEAFH